jgi:GxxExxY protein
MDMELNEITQIIIGSAIDVHKVLGPGLLESAYETCLAFELRSRGLKVLEEEPLPLMYHDVKLDCGYRLDLLVEKLVIVEIKAVGHILPLHRAQLLSYLKLSNLQVGLLINFHVYSLKDGICRIVNNLV